MSNDLNYNLPDDAEWRQMRRGLRKWGLRLLGLVLALVAVTSVIGFGLRWLGGTANIVSFDNFEQQHFQLQQDWESMQAVAGNVCSARESYVGALERGAPEATIAQRESQMLAHETNYRRIAADYDRRMANFFETLDGFVAPSELPNVAPSLDDQLARTC